MLLLGQPLRHLPLRRHLTTTSLCLRAQPLAPDAHLRAAFDDAQLWQSAVPRTHKTGLFGHKALQHPRDLQRLSQHTILKANVLVRRICDLPALFAQQASSRSDALLTTAIHFDRLSDLLCSVIDPSEFIRNVVSQPEWKLQAEQAFTELCEYMNILNTHTELYQVIKAVLEPFATPPEDPQLYAAYQVSLQFLRDFEKSGIHLPDSQRQRFVELNNDILTHGWQFANASAGLATEPGASGPDASQTPNSSAYLTHPSGDLRRQAWIAQHTRPAAVHSLEALLAARLDLARLLGHRNYAQLALSDKMAKSPSSVWRFLETADRVNAAKAEQDSAYLASLRDLKTLAPWDRDYCSTIIPAPRAPPLSPFFSVGTCVQGLSRLLQHIFGLSLQVAASEEWIWDAQVRKVEVRSESGQFLGSIYMDLFSRKGKAANAAHYTVQCARRTSWDDEAGDMQYMAEDEVLGETLRPRRETSDLQRPVVVLSLDFKHQSNGPTTLLWQQVETLFHEMGHAIHSMLGQTAFQNVSGTRCATDFVELPSILMEHFCSSPQVLSLYARHCQTDEPLPMDVFRAHQAAHARLDGLEQQHQISLSALDLAYHTRSEQGSVGWTTTAAWEVLDQFGAPGSSLGRATNAAWQVHFSHLASYGATYYSYLLDRAMAKKLWSHLFASSGGMDRDAGEQYKRKVLQWGGGKDPWDCLAEVLEHDQLRDGGDAAMSAVGL